VAAVVLTEHAAVGAYVGAARELEAGEGGWAGGDASDGFGACDTAAGGGEGGAHQDARAGVVDPRVSPPFRRAESGAWPAADADRRSGAAPTAGDFRSCAVVASVGSSRPTLINAAITAALSAIPTTQTMIATITTTLGRPDDAAAAIAGDFAARSAAARSASDRLVFGCGVADGTCRLPDGVRAAGAGPFVVGVVTVSIVGDP
jgi:hypothetical protein